MAIPNEEKQRAMDAVSHRETATQTRLLRRRGKDAAVGGPVAAPPPGAARDSVFGEVKRQAMNAVSNVETVAQVGMVKMTGGVALYTARIRQMDREAMQQKAQSVRTPQRGVQTEHLGRDYG